MVLKYKKYTEIEENVKKKETKETLPSGKLLCLEFEILSTFYMVLLMPFL